MLRTTNRNKLVIFYISLIIGSIVMNYMILNYDGYTDLLIEKFQNLDKQKYVSCKELFIYTGLKRIKQLTLITIISDNISNKIVLYMLPIYIAFIIGLILSLTTYYYGITGIIIAFMLLIPFAIFYGGTYFCLKKNSSNITKKTNKNRKLMIIEMCILIIASVIFEMCINNLIPTTFFNNK